MEQLVKERMERCTISMEPMDWAIIHQVAKDMGLASRSAGVRFIIRDWQRLKLKQLTLPLPEEQS